MVLNMMRDISVAWLASLVAMVISPPPDPPQSSAPTASPAETQPTSGICVAAMSRRADEIMPSDGKQIPKSAQVVKTHD